MAQNIFSSDLNTFCRKFLVKTPGVADPKPDEFAAEMNKQQTTLFENLLLFDKLSFKIIGESIAIPVLIGIFGQKSFDSLIEQGAIEFVLWPERVGFFVNNIRGVDGMVSMTHNTPEYTDPERSVESGLSWMRDAPTGRKRQQLVRRLVPLFRKTEANLAATSLKVVRDSLRNGGLEHYGIPKIAGHADNLTDPQKTILSKCAEDLAEYEFLVKNNMTSFSDYRYFSPFWSSAQRFQIMNQTVTGFSSISTLEGLPDLKALFSEITNPVKRVSEIRKTTNARFFREWLEKTVGESPDGNIVKGYLDSISERKGILDTTPRKLLKTVALATVGVSTGTVVASYTKPVIGVAAGAAAIKAAEKIAEITTETAVGLLDMLVLERVTKGRSPRMFFDDLSKLREVAGKTS
jgi:hypothetical protein